MQTDGSRKEEGGSQAMRICPTPARVSVRSRCQNRGETVSLRRTPARSQPAPSRPTVKTTVVLDADTHTKLVAAAILRGVDRSTYAASILREGLKGVVCFDKAMSADQGEISDRHGMRNGISPDADEAA